MSARTETAIAALDKFNKTLGIGFGILLAIGLVGVTYGTYSDSGRQEAFSACMMRQIEFRVEAQAAQAHLNSCMAGSGYTPVVECKYEAQSAACYAPSWRN